MKLVRPWQRTVWAKDPWNEWDSSVGAKWSFGSSPRVLFHAHVCAHVQVLGCAMETKFKKCCQLSQLSTGEWGRMLYRQTGDVLAAPRIAEQLQLQPAADVAQDCIAAAGIRGGMEVSQLPSALLVWPRCWLQLQRRQGADENINNSSSSRIADLVQELLSCATVPL